MVGDHLNHITSCSNLALVVGSDKSKGLYEGWGDNFTSFQSVLKNIPSNMENETHSFLCLNDEKVYKLNEDACTVTDFNLTATQYYSLARGLTPVVVLSNFTAQSFPTTLFRVGSPLNGVYDCGQLSISALYEDGKMAPTWNGTKPIEHLLQLPNASSVRNLSITCDLTGFRPWMWDCNEQQSSSQSDEQQSLSQRVDVPILLAFLLASMSLFFANVLL
ncbi:hypothetical protein MNAN1_003540 [Malassezia nana]|uniref:Uncharacterized protein n=1 Tax=Malassezia nana TaxID=180528 RepID=A0AAF0EP75_9BASI|nr:hypothetical protein MNAN1_003540 [Malassezia nana]